MYELAAHIIPCYLGTADIMDLLYSLPVSYFLLFDFTKLTPQFSLELFSSLCKSSCFRIRLFKPPLQKKRMMGFWLARLASSNRNWCSWVLLLTSLMCSFWKHQAEKHNLPLLIGHASFLDPFVHVDARVWVFGTEIGRKWWRCRMIC